MTEEQAIENLKEIIELSKEEIDKKDENLTAILDLTDLESLNILLSMLKNKDKIIDLMAEFIEDELTVDEFCTREDCYADNYIDGHCEKCLNCIKQYFENKAKEVK